MTHPRGPCKERAEGAEAEHEAFNVKGYLLEYPVYDADGRGMKLRLILDKRYWDGLGKTNGSVSFSCAL